MQRQRRRLVAALCSLPAVAATAFAQVGAPAHRTATWDELLPKDWDPLRQFRQRNLGAVPEGSAEERALMKELREIWDNAPTRAELDGARLRLPGYVVPLDAQGGATKEFLLVPYFGACVHSPPPPANQIVHVALRAPQRLRTMDAVWASGTLSVGRRDSAMGTSGYSMAAHAVEPYTPKR